MAIKLSREQRDAIYAEIMLDLSGTGDIQIELDNGDYEAARRHRRRFEDDMRLLDDIGWEPKADGEEFELSMPADQLARALRHLNANAHAMLDAHVAEPIDQQRRARQTLIAQTAYGDLLGQLSEAASGESS